VARAFQPASDATLKGSRHGSPVDWLKPSRDAGRGDLEGIRRAAAEVHRPTDARDVDPRQRRAFNDDPCLLATASQIASGSAGASTSE
jgi:hypothetical protein